MNYIFFSILLRQPESVYTELALNWIQDIVKLVFELMKLEHSIAANGGEIANAKKGGWTDKYPCDKNNINYKLGG